MGQVKPYYLSQISVFHHWICLRSPHLAPMKKPLEQNTPLHFPAAWGKFNNSLIVNKISPNVLTFQHWCHHWRRTHSPILRFVQRNSRNQYNYWIQLGVCLRFHDGTTGNIHRFSRSAARFTKLCKGDSIRLQFFWLLGLVLVIEQAIGHCDGSTAHTEMFRTSHHAKVRKEFERPVIIKK